jgi:hypothetical protein
MPREAKLFSSSSGSAVRGFLKYRANIPPRWIRNARTSRKRLEPAIVQSLGSLKLLRKARPRAQVAIKNASKEVRAVLNRWEPAYNKENFYRGIRTPTSSWADPTVSCDPESTRPRGLGFWPNLTLRSLPRQLRKTHLTGFSCKFLSREIWRQINRLG